MRGEVPPPVVDVTAAAAVLGLCLAGSAEAMPVAPAGISQAPVIDVAVVVTKTVRRGPFGGRRVMNRVIRRGPMGRTVTTTRMVR